MAWLRTLSDRVVTTRSGFSYRFIANVPRNIPEERVQYCLDEGCILAKDVPKIEVKSDTELDEALRVIIGIGDPDSFKVDKTPKVAVVNSLLTEKRSAKDIAIRFAEIMSSGDI